MTESLKLFGAKLAALRKLSGKTQEQLEKDGAAHRTYVSELERGEKDPSLTTILKLAQALGVSPCALIEGSSGTSYSELSKALTEGVESLWRVRETRGAAPSFFPSNTVQYVENELARFSMDLGEVLSESTRVFYRSGGRSLRDSITFHVADKRPAIALRYTTAATAIQGYLSPATVCEGVRETNRVLELLHDMAIANGVPLFKLLGMRNLSSFVGEIFKSELCRVSGDCFVSNPNQDGYPDLMAHTDDGRAYIAERTALSQMSDKTFWSPYPFGGVEIKATCGNTPPAKKRPKPQIGESRWPILESAEWKAHHRKTNNLIGIYWDFIDGLPTVLAAFYRNDLTPSDWGEVIKPKSDESATTSVSIMTRGRLGEELGVKKMARGWIVLPRHPQILAAITKPNVFHLNPADISGWSNEA